jgi:hypothetical protein
MARRFASVNVGQCSTNPGDGPECVVTSGKGAVPISYKGQTYYVCYCAAGKKDLAFIDLWDAML